MTPRTFLKRKKIWLETPGHVDLYQEGIHPVHSQPLEKTAVQVQPQEQKPDGNPADKGLENDVITR